MNSASSTMVLFDLYAYGHHPGYLRALVERWPQYRRGNETLHLVLGSEYPEAHPEFMGILDGASGTGVTFELLPAPERPYEGVRNLLRLSAHLGKSLRDVVQRLNPTCAVMMYMDHLQVPLLGSLRFRSNVRMAGILFRTTEIVARAAAKPSLLIRHPRAARKSIILRYALRNPHLDSVFCLDPNAVEVLTLSFSQPKFHFLPDPVDLRDESPSKRTADLTNRNGLTISLCGFLSAQKGVVEFMHALPALRRQMSGRIAVTLAGPIQDDIRSQVYGLVEAGAALENVSLHVHDRVHTENELQNVIDLSDVVAIPYRNHVGMSNILVRAAAAGRPVVGPSDGLVALIIAERRLGVTCDTASPESIADAIARLAANQTAFYDAENAASFARENSSDRFAEVFFSNLPGRRAKSGEG